MLKWSACIARRFTGALSQCYAGISQRRLCFPVALLLLLSVAASAQTKTSSAKFPALSREAAKARDANQLAKATGLYRQALALRPGWPEGWWSLGTLEYDQNQYQKAAEAFRKLLALQPSNGTAHAMLGLCQFEIGQDALALKNLQEANRLKIVNNDDLRKVALYHLGVLQLRALRFGDAQETLSQVAKEQVRSEELITALGESALLIDPRSFKGVTSEQLTVVDGVGKAEALSATTDFDQAKKIYTELTTQFPHFPNLHFAYGRLLLEAHETDEAVAEFRRELDRDPKNVNSMLEIASVRYRVDSEEGLKYAEQAVNLAPRMPFAHYLLGLLRLDTGNAAGAVPELELAREARPNVAKIYFSLGTAYARVGRKQDAAKARAEFLRLDKRAAGSSGSNFYGERPAGLSEGQLRTEDRGSSPK